MHEHCWHTTGIEQRQRMALADEVCCWCGQRRTVAWCGIDAGKHGPFTDQNSIVLEKVQVVAYAPRERA